jgi:WD40 repeat protein/DNA-binding SARP family transcriptional activator
VQLELSALGSFQALVDGFAARFATDHGRALLAYLAVEADRPHARAYLAYLLWPDHPEAQALNNLRQTLIRLRNALRMGDELATVLQITAKSLQFHAAGAFFDVRQFQQLVAQCKAHNHRNLEQCIECMQRLEQATALYQGEFLQGLSLRHSQPFVEWAVYVREELHHQMLSVLGTLANHYEAQGDYFRARSFVARQLVLEPWQEEVHCQMMRVLAKSGQRAAAILQYETCKRVLQEELSIAPSSETTLLYERIKAGTFERMDDLAAHARLSNPAVPVRSHWGELPVANRLYGRQAELAELEKWLIHEQCQLIMVLGMGGIGKSAITASAVETASRHYDLVLWRSLQTVPTLAETLRDWLSLLVADEPAELPDRIEAQLALLLHHLRQRRCLLVLDNLEDIFRPDQPGQMLPDYAGYAALLQQIAEAQHNSCLILTSREQLQAFALMQKEEPKVRTLRLEGLDAGAAQSLLLAHGLTLQESQAAALVSRYSGNPMALKLVAETIQEVFAGSVASFLSSDAVIFDDIGAVLEAQFKRLPALEQGILLWLAIEREPVSLETLRSNLSPPRPTPDVIQAVRALQRRSLLQRANPPETLAIAGAVDATTDSVPTLWTDTRFATPNVIMEYLVGRLVQVICAEITEAAPAWLHSYCLMQAQAKEYVRQSQVRLILQPVAEQLNATFGRNGAGHKILHILNRLRDDPFPVRGYAAGNLLNLLLWMEIDLDSLDLSGLAVWQADLRHANLSKVKLTGADLARSRFADAFGYVHTVAVSPNGLLIAAGTSNGEIRLWHAASGQLLQIYRGHHGSVRSLAFRPDGKILASSGEDHRVRLWDVQTIDDSHAAATATSLTGILQGHTGRVMSVAFHPSGNMLASAGVDGTIRLWDVMGMETRAVLTNHEQPVWSVAFSPDGRFLASGDAGGVVCLWDAQRAELHSRLTGHTELAVSLAFDSTGKWLASGSHDRTVCVWDVASGDKLITLEAATDLITAVAVSPNGTLLAAGGDDRTIRLWETDTWTARQHLHGHGDAICGLAFTPDGQSLVSAGVDQSVYLWHLPSARIHRIFSGYSQHINALAYHPNGSLLASGHYDRVVRLWDTETHSLRQSLNGHSLSVTAVTFSQDGTLLASASNDKSIQVWAISTPPWEIRRLYYLRGHQRSVMGVALLPDGMTLLSGSEDQTIGVWELENGLARSFVMAEERPIWYIQANKTGSLLATSAIHNIKLWHLPALELCKEVRGHSRFVWSTAFSTDNRWMASGGSDGSVALWDVQDPANAYLHSTLHGHTERVFAVAFSADGSYLASAGADQNVCLWDAQTHQLLYTLKGHRHWIWSVAFSPDGRTLASGGIDETIRLWDTQSGNNVATLKPPGPYAGMEIGGATGISAAERAILKRLGAVDA